MYGKRRKKSRSKTTTTTHTHTSIAQVEFADAHQKSRFKQGKINNQNKIFLFFMSKTKKIGKVNYKMMEKIFVFDTSTLISDRFEERAK